MKKLLIVFFFFPLLTFGQIDTLFWFAAPEVTSGHGDRPIYLRMTSYSTTSIVTVMQPARGDTLAIDTIPADNTISIDLTAYIDSLENTVPDAIDDKGLLVHATSPITAYYEVLGTSPTYGIVNSDLYVLKGKNGLGTDFYCPFQTHWVNQSLFPAARASFVIVATEDNTTIEITPTENLQNNNKNITYTITLDRGETYMEWARSTSPLLRPSGTHITADKAIAVTISDDSILQGSSYDLAGDQLVPVDFVGQNYIAVRTSSVNTDRVFITATQDNTQIFINGNTSPIATIDAGKTYKRQLQSPAEYIQMTAPAYVFHISGYTDELGGALLPSVGECTGSSKVGFTRDNAEPFNLNILVEAGAEDGFILNGTDTLIDASDFFIVPGTNGFWLAASISFTTTEIPPLSANLIENDSADFHLGLFNGSPSPGFRYGYFSEFAQPVELGQDRFLCVGDSIVLNAGGGKESYSWNTGDTTQAITVNSDGKYVVTTQRGLCSTTDSVHVSYYPEVLDNLISETDTTVCSNIPYEIVALEGFEAYLWNDSTTNEILDPDTSGIYTLVVTDENGCKGDDTVNVTINQAPFTDIMHESDKDIFCTDSVITLDAGAGFVSYLWNTGEMTQMITTNQLPRYWVEVTDANNCTYRDYVDYDCSTYIWPPNMFTPNGDGYNEVFKVNNLHPGTWSLEVYNRFGGQVFYAKEYANNFDGEGLSDGVYYYHMKHYKGKGERKGWIYIVK